MGSIPIRIPIRAFVFAALATGVAVFMPTKAEGTCGSYVMIVESTADMPHESPPVPPACHGPSCSKLPAVPVSPVSTAPISFGEMKQLFATVGDDHADVTRSRWPRNNSDSRLPARLPSSIFHPPRDN
jgi:hypothetical protein